MQIRYAWRDDLPAIVAIYNAAIPTYRATADTSPVTVRDRETWFAAHDAATHPLWVAEDDGQIVGWVSFSTFYARPAWDPTVEISVYVRTDRQRAGVGRALVEWALAAAPGLGIVSVLAFVAGHNDASLGLFDSLGFARWGRLPRVVHMPDERRDIVILGWQADSEC